MKKLIGIILGNILLSAFIVIIALQLLGYQGDGEILDDININQNLEAIIDIDNDELLTRLSQGDLFESFFGEYILTEHIFMHRSAWNAGIIPDVDLAYLIGTEVYMNYNMVSIDGDVVSESPVYRIIISSPNPPILGISPAPSTEFTQFSIFVSVERIRENNTVISRDFQFHIYDKDTLYLIWENSIYRLERKDD